MLFASYDRCPMLSNRSMPACTVIPEIPYPDIARAIDWLCDTFGFTLRIRMGDHRAQLNVGDGAVVLTNGTPAAPSSTMIRVADADAHHQHAVARGSRILRPPTDFPYGERQYAAVDLAGHHWHFSQSIADVDPTSWGGSLE